MKFDDFKLINFSKSLYYASETSPQRYPELSKIFDKPELTNGDRNLLIDYITQNYQIRPKSMATMKKALLDLIGFKSEFVYQTNTVSRPELEAIYNFIFSKSKD